MFHVSSSMIYFIHGKDNFLSELRLKEVLSFYLKNKPFFVSYEFTKDKENNPDINEIRGALLSKPLFGSTKVILIQNIIQMTDENYLKGILETLKEGKLKDIKNTMVIFYEDTLIDKNKFKEWLIRNSIKVDENNYLTGLKLINWIKKQEEKLKINLTKEARDLIVSSLENDTRAIFNVLTKLSRLKKQVIDREFLEKYISLPIKTNIFEFLDSVSSRKINRALYLLKKEIASGSHPLYIFKMIINQFRNLIKIKSLKTLPFSPPKNLKIHPFVYRKLSPISKNYSFEELKKIYSRLLFYDRKIKEGSFEPELALELFLLDIKR